jgi:hypothetical protein
MDFADLASTPLQSSSSPAQRPSWLRLRRAAIFCSKCSAFSCFRARLGYLIPTRALKKNLAFLAVPLEFLEANADTDGLSDGS